MRILVTGATGFVGGRLCENLLARGHTVRALVRKPTDDARVPNGVEIAVATLEPGDALNAAVADVDAVVHSAGGGRVRSPADFYTNNTETTRSILDACLDDGGPTRFVLVSSVAAKGQITHYGKSKRQAEELVLAAADRLTAVVVRPPAVYGPGDDRMLPLFRGAARGIIPRTSSPTTRMSFIYIDDCADALAAVATDGAGLYEADDGPARTWKELAAALGEGLGRARPPRVIGVPRPVLVAAALVSETWGRLTDRAVVLTRDKVLELTESEPVTDSSSLRSELGWSHQIGFVEGARLTADWYRAVGSL